MHQKLEGKTKDLMAHKHKNNKKIEINVIIGRKGALRKGRVNDVLTLA